MAKFRVKGSVVFHAQIEVEVEGETKDEAIENFAGLLPTNAYDAMRSGNRGWKAKIQVNPPRGVIVPKMELKATVIEVASGRETAKKV